jgi:hypothetical protein
MNYIGLDPGSMGGGVVINDISVIHQFVIKIDKERNFKINEFIKDLSIISKKNSIIILEDVHSIFGMSAKSNFNFGKICGQIEGIITTLGYKYIKVQPKIWQKEILGDMEKIKKKDSNANDTKQMALIKSKELFPDFNNLATPRCSKPHDGLIDALLIAEWGRRIYK